MLNFSKIGLNVAEVISIILIITFILIPTVFAINFKPDIYDLWTTISEFEETNSLRKFLIEKDWVYESVTIDEFDYILVLTQQCSHEFFPNVPTSLVLAIISVESGFRQDLLGYSNDTGLMQIIPKWHRDRIEKYMYDENVDLYDPRLNVMVGMDYLSELMVQFNNDIPRVSSYYNLGYGNPASAYAQKVMERMNAIQEFLERR